MENRSWSTKKYSEILPYFCGEKIKIRTVEATRKHTTEVYWIPPSGRGVGRSCDECERDAEFIYFDQDHTMRYYLRLHCNEHAWPDFIRWLNEAK